MSNNSPPSPGLKIQGMKTVPPLSVHLNIGSEIKSLSDLMRNMEFTNNKGANEYFVTYVARKKEELKKLLNPKVIEILELLEYIKKDEETNQKKVYYIDSLKKIILKKIQELGGINIFEDLINLKLYDDDINNSLREVLSIIINYTPIDRTVNHVKVNPVTVSPTTVIPTTVQPTFPAVSIDTSPKKVLDVNLIKQPNPLKQPNPSEKLHPNKIKSWFASMRAITLTRASLLKQRSKQVFNNKNVRRGFMGLVASLALASDVSLLNKNEQVNSTPEALGVALKVAEESKVAEARLLKAEEYRKDLLTRIDGELKKFPDTKISLPPLPILDTDYQISFKNKKELSVPAGSNVWRVVESDLKKQVSNLGSLNSLNSLNKLNKKSQDTIIANVIKAISAQHPNMNLSMIKAGQKFNMPNILLKNK